MIAKASLLTNIQDFQISRHSSEGAGVPLAQPKELATEGWVSDQKIPFHGRSYFALNNYYSASDPY
jgi:hypothetical protein